MTLFQFKRYRRLSARRLRLAEQYQDARRHHARRKQIGRELCQVTAKMLKLEKLEARP